jgi:predicted permease
MRLLSSILGLITAPFRRSRINSEMDDELRSHIQHRADDLERSGLPRHEAERRARIDFGGYERYKVECHEASGGNTLETFAQDLRFGLRMLRKSPGFTLTALGTLALAIGANAVVFSILNGLVLRPIDVPEPQNLVMLARGSESSSAESQSYPDYVDLRDRNHAFDGLIAYYLAPAALNSDGTPQQIWLYESSGNYFDVLGVQPALGRFFHASDEHGPDSAPYIVLSHAYWETHFQSDPGVVGRVVRLNKLAFTILGVAPKGFRGTERFINPDVWVPMVDQKQIYGPPVLEARGARDASVIGRLKAGVSPAQAVADLNSIATWLAKTYPHDDEGLTFRLVRPGLFGDVMGNEIRTFMAGLTLLSALILLAACANLGSLFAARAADRSREIAVRLALGSSRRRIVRQLLMEAMLVSLAGSALGLAATIPLLRAMSAWRPLPHVPVNVPVNPDAGTYVFALALALVSGLIFGAVPVRSVLRADPYQGIKSGTAGTLRTSRFGLRDLLLAGQIAVCAVLVASSLVAVRGMVRSLRSNFGFAPENAFQVYTGLSMGGYSAAQVPAMQKRILDAVSAIPGVSAAGYADSIPLTTASIDSGVYTDAITDYRPSNIRTYANQYSVSPGYFEAAYTTLRHGRTFTWNDVEGAPRVAVVNQQFARLIFGSEDRAIGQHFKMPDGERVLVVGVVEDGKYKSLSEDPQPAMFFSILQHPSFNTFIIVRSRRDPKGLAASLERTLRGLNTGTPFVIDTWTNALDWVLFSARAASIALGVLGALGAMLAVTGIFGMAAYSVSRRLRELGIRIALGAKRSQVLSAALGRALRLLLIGSVAGLGLGLAATKLLSFIVYQATPRDPLVLAGVVVFMLLIGLLATWIPARRALAADPLVLLRDE